MEYLIENPEVNTLIYCIKTYLICIFTYYTSLKTVNVKQKHRFTMMIILIPIAIIGGLINDKLNHLYSIMIIELFLSILFSKFNQK